MKIEKIANGAEYRMDEQIPKIANFWNSDNFPN